MPSTQSAVLAAAAAVFVVAAAPPPVCDFRLAFEAGGQYSFTNESTIYSQSPGVYQPLGLSVRTAVVINAEYVGAGKPEQHGAGSCTNKCCVKTVDDFNSMQVSTIEACWAKFMLTGGGSKLEGGNATTNVVVIDIEACGGDCHPRHWWNFTDSALRELVGGFKRRLAVVRNWLPHATLGLYGTTVHGKSGGINVSGYQRAAAMGVFDDWDYLGKNHLVPIKAKLG